MPISGLVVSLAADPEQRQRTCESIAADPRVEVGETRARRMAVVVETASSDEDREFWEWLNGLTGVAFVDVVFVGFEQPDARCSKNELSSSCTNKVRAPEGC